MKKIISFEKKLDFPSMVGEITAISLDHNLKFVDGSNVEGEFTISGKYKLTEASRIEENFEFKVPADIVLGEQLDLSTAKVEIDDFYYEIENEDTLICYIDVKVEGVEEIDIKEEERARNSELLIIEPVEETEEIEEAKIEEAKIEEPKTEEINLKQEFKVAEAEEKVEELTTKKEDYIEDDIPKIEEKYLDKELSVNVKRECDGDTNLKDLQELENNNMIEENSKDEVQESVGSIFSSLNESDETYSTYSVYILRQEETVSSLIEKYKTTKEELENYNDLSNLTVGTKIIIPVNNE